MLQLADRGLDVIWTNREMRNHMATCVLIDGYLFGFDEAVLKCLLWKTGEVQWSQRGLGKGSLMAADGKLIVLSDGGELLVADASREGFRPQARAKILNAQNCWTVPVLVDGMIYCRSSLGQLVCLDVRVAED